MSTVNKLLAGTGILVAVYLVLTNPNGFSADTNSLSGAYVSGVKAVQAR